MMFWLGFIAGQLVTMLVLMFMDGGNDDGMDPGEGKIA